MSQELSIYELTKDWFNFCFENPELINPNHSALFFFILSHSNRLGWKPKLGLPTTMAKEAIGIKSYNTYIKTLNELEKFGCIKIIERSKNQYSTNIIAISKFDKAVDKALDKATVKHVTKQSESAVQSTVQSTEQSNCSIIIPYTNTQSTNTPQDNLTVDWSKLLEQFNSITGKKIRVLNDKAKRQFKARLKEGYTKTDIVQAIINCFNDSYHRETGHKYLTLEFISRADKMEKYANVNPDFKPPKTAL